jgi:hypothetical protein
MNQSVREAGVGCKIIKILLVIVPLLHLVPRSRTVELYLHSLMILNGVVLA